MSRVEVIISTMNRPYDDFSLIKKMNIQTDAIIINQTNNTNFKQKYVNGNRIRIYSFEEQGVGLSRNSGLMRSDADICMIADDDMVYMNNYENIILNAYDKNPTADFIISNVRIHYPDRTITKVKNQGKLKIKERFRFGTVTFSFKRNQVIKNNLFFSLLFGGGSIYGSGEDTLFLWDAINSGLNVYKNPELIAEVNNYKSSWFTGFNEKYYFDKGALYKALSPNFNIILNIYIILRTKKLYKGNLSFRELMQILKNGAEHFENL